MRTLIKNAHIVDALSDYPDSCDILIADDTIKQIGAQLKVEADEIIDAAGLTAIPGLVDMHCHLREPGFEYKETVLSGTKAAAKGGYTTVCSMPNTSPVIDSREAMLKLIAIIKSDAMVNVLPIAAISLKQQGKELVDMEELNSLGAAAFSDDGQPVYNNSLMLDAMIRARQSGYLIIDHCEDHGLVKGGVINLGNKAVELGLPGISCLSEELPIARDIMLAKETDCNIHIAHISTKGSVELIRAAKQRGISVTCEATPHHIALSDEIITPRNTDCKVNPPLRSSEDVYAIKQGLKDGTIDVIATDHAPHHTSEKGSDFYKAANGISGLETAFSVCYTELVASGLITLKELAAKLCHNPSKILGINRGRIAEGQIADIALIDLNKTVTINKNEFLSMGKNTPFHGRSYKGEVVCTIAEGKVVYKKEEMQ